MQVYYLMSLVKDAVVLKTSHHHWKYMLRKTFFDSGNRTYIVVYRIKNF